MAFRYRQITPQSGDLINPDDWNVNVREFTNEFNGHLDRDNLPEKGITTASIKPEAFHIVQNNLATTNYTILKTQTRFKEIQIIEFETQHQGLVVCEWSGSWEYETIKTSLHTGEEQELDYRILVNGTEVTRIRRDNNLKRNSSGYMVGATPVEAGYVRVTVEAKTKGAVFLQGTDFESNTEGYGDGDVTLKHRELVVVLRKA